MSAFQALESKSISAFVELFALRTFCFAIKKPITKFLKGNVMPRLSLGNLPFRFSSVLILAATIGLGACSSAGNDGDEGVLNPPSTVTSSSTPTGTSSSNGGTNSSTSTSTSTSTSNAVSSSSSSEQVVGGENPITVNIAVEQPSLEATESTTIVLTFTDENGDPAAVPGEWTAGSRCSGVFTSNIERTEVTTTRVTFNYTADGCVGEDIVRLEASDGDDIYVVTTTITVAPDSVNSIVYLGAEPSQIAIQGSGGDEIATVRFRVRGVNSPEGTPAQTVQFRVEGVAGGLSLVNQTDISDEDGIVEAQVQSGTTPTNVTIIARHVETGVEAPSNGLVVATGLAADNYFKISRDIANPWAWNRINSQAVNITVAVTDKSGNPVVDGTIVNFVSEEGGSIIPQCTTVNNTCSVEWKPNGVEPPNGRVQVFATVKGTEDYIDNNGNKVFDNGDTFTPYNDDYDLGEPYSDNDEDGEYDVGEHFVDSNGNNIRDGADGLWNGLNCNDTARCSTNQTFVDLGTQLTLYQSNGYGINICERGGFAANSFEVAAEGVLILGGLFLNDSNPVAENPGHACAFGNPLPNGTNVSFSVSGGSLQGVTSWNIGNASAPTGPYGISYKAPSTGGSETLVLTVTVPSPGGGGEEVIGGDQWTINVLPPPEPEE